MAEQTIVTADCGCRFKVTSLLPAKDQGRLELDAYCVPHSQERTKYLQDHENGWTLEELEKLSAEASGEHDGFSCYCYAEGWGKNRCRVGPAEKRLSALGRKHVLALAEALGPFSGGCGTECVCKEGVARSALANLKADLEGGGDGL